MTRFGPSPVPPGTSIIMMNHRPVARSKRMRGSLVKVPLVEDFTDAKKTSESRLSAPSVVPLVLLNDRNRPLTATIYCVGPTAPMLSGGNAPVSFNVAPVKLVLVVCGVNGPLTVGVGSPIRDPGEGSPACDTNAACGFCGRWERSIR